jgi:hypothetical protein
LLTTSSTSAAAGRLVVRTYDMFGVAAEEMRTAHANTTDILKDAGLEVVWRDCSAGCPDPVGSEEVVVRIVTAPASIGAESLGCAIVDVRQGMGTLATVYADRIGALASRTGVSPGRLLGRAIAHEIGHLLLGTARHSAAGLMRALWSNRDLERDVISEWTFSTAEVARIGRRLALRSCRSCPIIAQRVSVWRAER